MVHPELGDAPAGEAAAHEQLGRDHRAVAGERERPQARSADELERAVDVAHPDAEAAPHQVIPRVCRPPPRERVGATEPVPGDEIVLTRDGHEPLQLGQIELEVAVGQQHPLAGGRRDARTHGRSVPAVGLVGDDSTCRSRAASARATSSVSSEEPSSTTTIS